MAKFRRWFTFLLVSILMILPVTLVSHSVQASGTKPVYDISNWQGYISDSKAAQLKNEVSFVILKAENGGLYTDSQFNHNVHEMNQNSSPYGAYDYSVYANDAQAAGEADALYQRAPQADFYVNDCEENKAGSDLSSATASWANEMHSLTKRPVVLYSDLSFMNHQLNATARNSYDTRWVADYGAEPNTSYHYDLWQYTDNHYSNALGKAVDASTFPRNAQPISYWTGGQTPSENAGESKGNGARVNYTKPKVTHHHRKHSVRKPNEVAKPKRPRSNRPVQKIRINPRYYNSRRIHFVQVVYRHGVRLFKYHHGKYRYLGHARRGTVLRVKHFKTFYYHRTGYMTKTVGYYHGHRVLFTANRHLIRRYR